MARFQREHGSIGAILCETAESVAEGCDALVLVTEWSDYRELDWESIAPTMRKALLLDGRHSLDAEKLRRAGFNYVTIS